MILRDPNERHLTENGKRKFDFSAPIRIRTQHYKMYKFSNIAVHLKKIINKFQP